jgi:hypothetical protein
MTSFSGVEIDMSVADEVLALRQHQHLHRRQRVRAGAQADRIANVAQVL